MDFATSFLNDDHRGQYISFGASGGQSHEDIVGTSCLQDEVSGPFGSQAPRPTCLQLFVVSVAFGPWPLDHDSFDPLSS